MNIYLLRRGPPLLPSFSWPGQEMFARRAKGKQNLINASVYM